MRKPKRELILYDVTPPLPDRLRAMIVACASGDTLDAAMRTEIVSALKSIEARQSNERINHAGAPVALNTFRAAALARYLIDVHHVKPARCAIEAAAETLRANFAAISITDQAVARAYRKIKNTSDCSMATSNGDKFQLTNITNGVIDDALARLPVSAEGTRTGRAASPPFAIAVAYLFDPD